MKIKQFKHYLANQPIRYKLFFSYFGGFVVALMVGACIVYYFVRETIHNNIENELNTSTTTILDMVQTSVSVSLKNYLRAVVEKNSDIASYYHDQFLKGAFSEQEAKRRAANVLLSQKIGNSGYIYCIDSYGVLQVHPKRSLQGVDISHYPFVNQQKKKKSGYLEYDWKNPGERQERPKALHMTYFEPWDWIISASSYREEFSQLVNVDDFREKILSLQFGKTGYPYVMTTTGILVIHPQLEGVNISTRTDASGRQFIKEVCRKRSGKIIYPWKNPGELTSREKLVIFNFMPELDWIVASSSYLDEFYAPLDHIRGLMIIGSVFFMVLFIGITFLISTSITNPLRELKDRFDIGATGDFTVRMQPYTKDEIGQLAVYFNTFMAKLEAYSTDLKKEIHERKQIEDALRDSEEMFSKAFLSSPNAIFIASLEDQRFINVNNSLLATTSYTSNEMIGHTLAETGLFAHSGDGQTLIRIVDQEQHISGVTIEFRTKSHHIRTGKLSAERIELWGRPCILATIEDVTEALRLEKEIMDISEKERLSIGQDLHDDLCPHLIGIEVLGKVLKKRLADKGIEEADLAEKTRALTMEAINKARNLNRGLCPVNLDINGFTSAVQELIDNIHDVFGVDCEFMCQDAVVFQDNSTATHLYYIIHEATHNAVRHSRADRISVTISKTTGRYWICIQDNGTGIMERPAGIGMRIMALRAKKIGANFNMRNIPGVGTTVEVNISQQQSTQRDRLWDQLTNKPEREVKPEF
jgi:PAS domain S-box-containing protein